MSGMRWHWICPGHAASKARPKNLSRNVSEMQWEGTDSGELKRRMTLVLLTLPKNNLERGGQEHGSVFEAKFMLPWSFSEEAAAEKHMAQLQHNMWVIQSRSAVLSIITGGGKWWR
jgi:hypothetical protein